MEVLWYNADMKSAKKAVKKAAAARRKAAVKKTARAKAGAAAAARKDGGASVPHPAFREEYTVEARNFGPIAEAKLALKPLTVLIGPSNTGKTWMATLACMMMRRHAEFSQGCRQRMDESESILEKLGEVQLRTFSAQLMAAIESGGDFLSVSSLPKELRVKWLTLIRERFVGVWADIGDDLQGYYGVGELLKLMADPGRAPAVCKYAVRMHGAASTEAIVELHKSRGGQIVISPKISDFAIPMTQSHALKSLKVAREIAAGKSSFSLRRQRMALGEAIRVIVRDTPADASVNFLPASRGGLLQAQRVTGIAMTRIASRAGVTGIPPIPTLSRTAVDFLEDIGNMLEKVYVIQAIEGAAGEGASAKAARAVLTRPSQATKIVLSSLMRLPSETYQRVWGKHQAVSRIEQLLGGKIAAMSAAGGNGVSTLKPPPTIGYHPWGSQSPLEMAQSSSMVGEIAPLVLYLKSGVGYGDTLFIEEPEAHLHPAAQTKMAEILAAMVRAGIRVVITTHSDWMLSSIANIVRRGELGGDNGEEAALTKEQVGVWLFDRGKKDGGATTRELAFDSVTGYIPKNLRDFSNALHNETADLLDAMDERERSNAVKEGAE